MENKISGKTVYLIGDKNMTTFWEEIEILHREKVKFIEELRDSKKKYFAEL